jgi:hypothetical protein
MPQSSQYIASSRSRPCSSNSPAAFPATTASDSYNLSPICPITPISSLTASGSTSSNGRVNKSNQLPTQGLLIPNVPVRLPSGGHSQKSESWKIIVDHWLYGDVPRGLHTALKDWPRQWLQGPNKIFAQKHFDRSVIALEFIET